MEFFYPTPEQPDIKGLLLKLDEIHLRRNKHEESIVNINTGGISFRIFLN